MSDMRTDIIANDVFISWTGKDAEIKDKVKKCLQAKGLNCTDSQCDCAGNYVEWSKQAATASHIMVLILTENSFKSKYQKTELQEVKKKKAFGADFSNRLVTFCPSQKIYDGEKFGENGEHLLADNYNSAAYFGEDVTQDALDGLADKVINLLLGRTFEIYKAACEASEKKIGLLSFFVDQQIGNTSVDYDKIYIERSVKDSDGKELSAQELLARGDLLLVYGPSGMGKTEYIKQLRRAVDPEVLTVVVRCSDLWRSDKTVYEYLCENVAKGVQNAAFTDKHFERLWDSRDRLVVFDGLDEVPTTALTDKFFQKISEFCRIKADYRRTQILFTSRNKDDANRFANDPTDIKSQLRSFELQPLNDDQIRKLCVSLSKVFEFDDEYFFFKIKRLDKEIKANPLLVSQLAIINNNYGEIPNDSMEMTEKLAEIIFGVEDHAKVLEVKGAKITDLRALVEAFAALKYESPEDGDGEVMGKALESCNERAEPAKVLEYFKKRAIYVDGRYLHKSLGEFFAAYGFARRACGLGGEVKDKELRDLVISHCGDESWGGIVNYFVRKTKLKTLDIPDGVMRIGEREFYKCGALTRITIPSSVTSIRDSVFSGCSSLTSITIVGSVTSIDRYAFDGCSSLTSITIPDSVTSIGSHAFSDCSSLTSITIPDGVTSIGSHAFSDCSSLTSITIPDGVTSIGNSAFSGCSSLSNITIPDSVTGIDNYAFRDCDSLTSITIGGSITSIGYGAFSDCRLLKSITIPKGVTSIDGCAFYGCSSLTSITIPDSVTSMAEDAFEYCRSIQEVHIGNIAAWCAIDFFGSNANPLYCGAALYLNGELVTSLEIPNSVTSIGDYAFLNCSSLTSITIPDSVTSIGEEAFSGCDSLESVTIGNGVTSIGSYAFHGCNSLTSITLGGGVTSMGEHAFANCSWLESITIPNSVTSIGEDAFRNCDSLTSVVISNGVTSIGNRAFSGCGSLTSIIIPDSVTIIRDCAFQYCPLISITIPDSVTYIGNRAFFRCYSLESVVIGNSVTSIGDRAFQGCSSLASITFQGTVEQWRAIDKGTEWNSSTGSFTITCTDGTLDKNGNQI